MHCVISSLENLFKLKLQDSTSSLIKELHQSTKIVQSDLISRGLSSSGYKAHPKQKLYH